MVEEYFGRKFLSSAVFIGARRSRRFNVDHHQARAKFIQHVCRQCGEAA